MNHKYSLFIHKPIDNAKIWFEEDPSRSKLIFCYSIQLSLPFGQLLHLFTWKSVRQNTRSCKTSPWKCFFFLSNNNKWNFIHHSESIRDMCAGFVSGFFPRLRSDVTVEVLWKVRTWNWHGKEPQTHYVHLSPKYLSIARANCKTIPWLPIAEKTGEFPEVGLNWLIQQIVQCVVDFWVLRSA